ncbi:hypothetical protein [Helicobacter ailurogastricus]|nr:hypothetical protein [Helicobacter ailurogastricus]
MMSCQDWLHAKIPPKIHIFLKFSAIFQFKTKSLVFLMKQKET